MPYISKSIRPVLIVPLRLLAATIAVASDEEWPGWLNYIISKLIRTIWAKRTSYATGNAIVGVLDCAKAEFIRRWLSPYEDKKILDNGDITIIGSSAESQLCPPICDNTGQRWTKQHDATLRQMVQDGVDIGQIAIALSRSINSIVYRIVHKKLKYR